MCVTVCVHCRCCQCSSVSGGVCATARRVMGLEPACCLSPWPHPTILPPTHAQVGFFHAYKDGVDYVFVDHPCFNTRGQDLYGGSRMDILFRCSMLSKAAIEAVRACV